jgi:Leucine-rich repeat (LRR) protein
MSEQKEAFIYENDLKFIKINDMNINSPKVFFDNEETKNNINIDSFSIDYRLKECTKNSSTSLDLSLINIKKEDIFSLNIDYSKILYLFLNDNNLSGEINLSKFSNLEVLDIENNNLTKIFLPKSLKELVINNNKLTELPTNINPIRLKANKNSLTVLPEQYTDIESLELSYNNITKIITKRKLRRLIIDSNPIECIQSLESLTYLDISDTNQVKLYDLPVIKNLVANSTKLTEIPNFKTLEVIELINTPIKKIQFFENFQIILCSYNLTKNISSKFIDLGKAHIKVKNNNVICISREEIN